MTPGWYAKTEAEFAVVRAIPFNEPSANSVKLEITCSSRNGVVMKFVENFKIINVD
jgi:hypothetical protein